MQGEFLLSGPLWPREPQGVSLSDFSLFSAPQSAGTPGKMQVYGTTANGALGFWINFNKVQVWRSGEDIKCPKYIPFFLIPLRQGLQPNLEQSSQQTLAIIPSLPFHSAGITGACQRPESSMVASGVNSNPYACRESSITQ